MLDSWLNLVDRVLRPARPDLERCLRVREQHIEAGRRVAAGRASALSDCVARIEAARAEAFAANNGVVSSGMTALEREWRTLSRTDADGDLMDLWARLVPSSWIDRKRWRGGAPAEQRDLAVSLAADVEGVETAEAAIDALRFALAPWETRVGVRARFRSLEQDVDATSELLAKPLRASREKLSRFDGEAVVLSRAEDLERSVHEAALARFPERALLARAIAHAAFADCVFRAVSLADRSNPVTPLRALWGTGYVPSVVDEHGVTIDVALV